MEPVATRGPEGDGEARERILVAAVELFASKGYAATSVREIVSAAGVTPPVLYYHFRSKEGLFLELMRGSWAEFGRELDAAREREATARERLSGLCQRMLALLRLKLGVVRLMYAVYYGPPQGAPFFDFDTYHLKFQETLRGFVQEGIAAGEFREDALEGMTWAVIGAFHIAMELELCHPDRALGPEGFDRVLDVVFRGMAAEGAANRGGA